MKRSRRHHSPKFKPEAVALAVGYGYDCIAAPHSTKILSCTYELNPSLILVVVKEARLILPENALMAFVAWVLI